MDASERAAGQTIEEHDGATDALVDWILAASDTSDDQWEIADHVEARVLEAIAVAPEV